MKTAIVTFLPDGQTLEVLPGRRVLAAVLDADRPIGYACRGLGVCVACCLWVEGAQSPVSEAEERLLRQVEGPMKQGAARRRIACLAKIEGAVTIQADYW
jgi:ferredoxin